MIDGMHCFGKRYCSLNRMYWFEGEEDRKCDLVDSMHHCGEGGRKCDLVDMKCNLASSRRGEGVGEDQV